MKNFDYLDRLGGVHTLEESKQLVREAKAFKRYSNGKT